jgi:hypothetical protein
MKIRQYLPLILGLIFVFFACKKEPVFNGSHDPEVIKSYRNEATPVSMMDSLSSVNFIAKQKLKEVYELASFYSSNKNDSILKDRLYPQIQSYFSENDSLKISQLLSEMDSLKVNFVEINNVNLPNDSIISDSVRLVNYGVKYYSSNKKLIDSIQKSAQFILKKEPKKFKHEFIFYFNNLNAVQEENDTVSNGVTQ